MTMVTRWLQAGLVWSLMPVLAASGAPGGGPAGPTVKRTAPSLLEVPDDPYIRVPIGPERLAPAQSGTFGGFAPVQVNVGPGGTNILGDAANEPSIAIDATAPNRIVIGWRQFDTVASNFRQAGHGYSADGGRTWTFPGVFEPGVFRSDPVLDYDAEGGIYYNSLSGDFTCQVFKSEDGGVTWGPWVSAFGGDKQWMAIDRTGGIGHGNIYTSWSAAAACCGFNTWCRSVDGGDSYQTPIPFPDAPRFGTMAVGPDGAQYTAGMRSVPYDPTVHLIARTTNAQDAFQSPAFDLTVEVDLGGDTVLGGPVNPAGLLGQVNVGVDASGGPLDGNVYMLASVDPPGGSFDPLDVHFIRSEDGGATWSAPVRVNDDPLFTGRYQWFGTMSVAPNGRIDVVWNDTRADALDENSQLYYSSSTDGGVTWAPNVALTVAFDQSLGYPNQNKLGDYYDMISDDVGAHVAFAATFNGEEDVYYLRIGDYDCNGNGIGDAVDLAMGPSLDCNGNDIPDECEIAAGTVEDANGNGVPDECECQADLDGDMAIAFSDLLILLGDWGPCGPPCPADFDQSGDVGFGDLLILLGTWGQCP